MNRDQLPVGAARCAMDDTREEAIASLRLATALKVSLSHTWLRRYEISARVLSWRTMLSRTCIKPSGVGGHAK
ncbi:MAG: hypothetical protein P8Y93_08875 [Acidobacteriota bacterium]